MKFTDIPEWTYQGKTPSVFTFFETIALAGLEKNTIRLSADVQRKLLGFPVFGKRAICVDAGVVHSYVKIAFGMDWDDAEYTAQMIKGAVENEKQLCPGKTGYKYYATNKV